MSTELKIQQWQEFDGDNWWKWAVWVEGSDQELDKIDYVEWILHPTFKDPIRKVRNRTENFRLQTGGWGVFPIVARLHKKDGTTGNLQHRLRLFLPDGSENND